MPRVAVLRYRLPDGVGLTFRFDYDGVHLSPEETFRGPQCRARTRAGRRCRNLVLEDQPGPRLYEGIVEGFEVDDPATEIRLREQACRAHVGTDFDEFCAPEWTREPKSPR